MKKILISIDPLFNNFKETKIPGYMISSKASINVEGDEINQEIHIELITME